MKLFTIKLGRYKKFIAAFASVIAIVGFAAIDGEIDSQEAAGIVSASIAAAAVLGFRNKTLDEVKAAADKLAEEKKG